MDKFKICGRVLIWLPAIFIAITIFSFSNQNGDESQGLSNKAAEVILTAGDNLGLVEFTDTNTKANMIEDLQVPIRKCAHMGEYAVLTMCLFIAFMFNEVAFRWSRILSLLLTIIWASSDEIHQLFIAGRAGRFLDVCIDTFGSLIFLGIVSLIHHHLEVKKEKNIFSELDLK